MKRLLLGVIVAGVVLSGCSNAPSPDDSGRTGWWEQTDPVNGRTFRCLFWSGSRTKTMWCYEPALNGGTDG